MRRDRRTRILFVSDGISGGTCWCTYWRKPNGSLARLKTPRLPLRSTWAGAQADLDEYACKHKLREHHANQENEPE